MPFSNIAVRLIFIFLLLGSAAQAQVFFYGEPGGVVKAQNINSGSISTIFTNASGNPNDNVTNISSDAASQQLFFSIVQPDVAGNEGSVLYRANFNGTNLETVSSGFRANGMEYEPAQSRLYYADVSNIGGNARGIKSVSLSGDINMIYACDDCTNLRLDKGQGKIYFRRADSKFRMNYDGSSLEELDFFPPVNFNIDILSWEMDELNGDIYWTDFLPFYDTISRVNYQGLDQEGVVVPTSLGDSILRKSGLFLDALNEDLYFVTTDYSLFDFPEDRIQKLVRFELDGTAHDTIEIAQEAAAWTIGLIQSPINQLEVEHLYTANSQETNLNNLFELNSCVLTGEASVCGTGFEVCADGSTASVFRIRGNDTPINANDLRIEIIDDGVLVDDATLYGSFSVLANESDGLYLSYTHPNWLYINNSTHLDLSLRFRVQGEILGTIPLRVWRTPVVIVHGWYSNKRSFDFLAEFLIGEDLYTEDLVRRTNYAIGPNLGVTDVDYFVLHAINSLKSELRIQHRIAAGAADILAHSTGGLLARSYLQSDYYQNDIHKLITVNTPHHGTQWANLVTDESTFFRESFCEVLENFDQFAADIDLADCDDKIIQDISIDSDFITALNTAPALNRNTVPTHTIATFEPLFDPLPDDLLSLIGKGLKRRFKTTVKVVFELEEVLVNAWIRANLYNGEDHDVFVPVSSQRGGVELNCNNCVTTINGDHWDIIDCDDYLFVFDCDDATQGIVNIIRDKLINSPTGNDFSTAGFAPGNIFYGEQEEGTLTPNSLSINITQPTPGSVFSFGSSFDLNVTADETIDSLDVYLEGENGNILLFSNQGNTGNFSVNTTDLGIGLKNILGIGNGSNGETTTTAQVLIMPTSNASDLSIEPGYLYLSNNQSYYFNDVHATFPQGEIDISSSPDLAFTSVNQLVDFTGNIMMPNSIGIDTVRALYQGLSSRPVVVEIVEPIDSLVNSIATLPLAQALSFVLYPSMPQDQLYVLFEGDHWQADPSVRMVVYDVTGRPLMQVRRNSDLNPVTTVDVSVLPEGLYYLAVFTADRVNAKPFIINK